MSDSGTIELIARFLDRQATPDESAELNLLIESSPQAASDLTDLARLDSLLETRFCDGRQRAALDRLLSKLECGEQTRRTLVFRRMVPSLASFGRSSTAASILGLAIVFYGAFTLIAWNLRPDRLPNGEHVRNTSVALVSDTANVQWSKDTSPKSAKTSIALGEPLNIDSGTIELELKRGAKLMVEGPAKWSIDGDNSATLHSGKLLATVPRAAAGFTVETATARIIDLGTEFSVEADANGASEVQVYKGKVELHPNVKHRDSTSATRPITLVAGDARRIERGDNESVVIRKVVSKQFADGSAAISSGLPKQIRVEGALASSDKNSLDISANFLIGGHGLTNGRHSATCQRTMWHSDYGRIEGEFVLFDLARFHRLDSMKVWNWNQRGMLWIGVKQADIYISTSGKGDPLSRPTEWKLVVDDQPIPPGTGVDDYDTPAVISLGNAETRFVAIVIGDAIGRDPRGPEAKQDCVGLSEVQFFGSRVATE